MISRRVVNPFEAWDPKCRTHVTIESGTVLINVRIVFDKRIGGGFQKSNVTVEFESGGIRFYAPLDLIKGGTSPDDAPVGVEADAQ